MSEFKPEKYAKYPVLIPKFKVEVKRLRDLTEIIKLMLITGLIAIASSSLVAILYHDPISYIIILLSLAFTLPFPINNIRRTLYELNWMRLRIESETPYFLSSIKFLVDSGRKLTESLKILVRERVFRYISDSLYGVQDATSDMEIIDIASRSRSPFLARAVRELYSDFKRIDRLIEDSLKKNIEYGVKYKVELNSMFKSIFYTIVLASLIPIIVIFYHSFTYQSLEESYIINWTYTSLYYLTILSAGLILILLAVILAYKPSFYPALDIESQIGKKDIAILSIILIAISIPAVAYPPYIIL